MTAAPSPVSRIVLSRIQGTRQALEELHSPISKRVSTAISVLRNGDIIWTMLSSKLSSVIQSAGKGKGKVKKM